MKGDEGVVKRGSIAYQCWQKYGIEEEHMIVGVCPICAAELAKGEEPEKLSNVGVHVIHSHDDFVKANGIMTKKTANVTPGPATVPNASHLVGTPPVSKGAEIPSPLAPLVGVGINGGLQGQGKTRAVQAMQDAADLSSTTQQEIQNASSKLSAKFAILKSAIGCPDTFFASKKILDIDVYVTPRMEGDVVHVQMNYIDLGTAPLVKPNVKELDLSELLSNEKKENANDNKP
jgi:hypothetical protein